MNKGEVVGIIGRNGAGKSTLLKIISGILRPTTGKVVLNGNIVPMLELGSGFDPDLTGAENIFLNGAILGYSKEFLQSKYDEIVRFSELGDFIRMPIRNYSSGMLMRLAFSIATVVQPEILIVDEILAVGDENFQKKSKQRMMELMGGGTTVLFVSHDMQSIREMCSRVVWLEGGTVKMFGDTETVCDAYDISAPDPSRRIERRDKNKEEHIERVSPCDFVELPMMQFDHFQRYETVRRLIEKIRSLEDGTKTYKILEVGANEQKNLGKMLPKDSICYSDVSLPDRMLKDPECIVLDATNMPEVEDQQYDFLISLDVFEHIPPEKRSCFLEETTRVARTVILGFPFSSAENQKMERRLSDYYQQIYGIEYIWVKEHLENGLPSTKDVEAILEEKGYSYVCFEHAENSVLENMLEAQFHFEHYRTGLLKEMKDITDCYENEVYPHDVGNSNYRCFFIISRDLQSKKQLEEWIQTTFVRKKEFEARCKTLQMKCEELKKKNEELNRKYS